VFIIGMQEGVLPHEASLEEGRLEEERRLLYVAITRAKEQLWMSYASGGKKWGERVTRLPSRFFEELPSSELHRDGLDPEADKARSQERSENALANIRALLGR
jgi:ATP-dependent DNA helicase Rep